MAARRTVLQVAFGCALALLLAHAATFVRFTIDDAYITFAYPKNLLHGAGLVFSRDQRVEATSSMLWALLLVPFEAFIANGAVVGSKVLGILCLLGVALVGARLVRRLLGAQIGGDVAGVVYALLVAGASPLVVWSTYGMENGLAALLLLCAVDLFSGELSAERGALSALPIFLLEAVRPESYAYIVVFIAFRIAHARLPGKRSLAADKAWFAIVAVGLAVYEAFGLLYYGHLFPNTVSAKVGGVTLARVKQGLDYLSQPSSAFYTGLFVLGATLAMYLVWSSARRAKARMQALLGDEAPLLLIVACLAAHWMFVISVGGDWMADSRFLSHFVPLVLVLVVVVAWRLLSMARARYAVGIACIALYLAANFTFGRDSHEAQAALQDAEERAETEMTVQLNRLAKSDDAVVACSDVGRIGYFFKGKVLDWWGLADAEIARSGQALGGVDPQVVLRRKPDFIILYSNAPQLTADSMKGNMAVYSRKFFADPEFQRQYHQVTSLHFWRRRWHVLFARND